jgi:hypothetical protein
LGAAGRRLVYLDVAILPPEPVAAVTYASPPFRVFLSATSGRPATDFPGSRPTDDQATLRGFPIVPALAAWLKRSSSSPARTAAISAGSLPFELTTIPALPFSNSSGLAPNFDGHDDLTGGVGLPHHAPTHLMRSRHRHRLGPSVAVEHSLCASQSEPSPSAE